MSAQSSDRMFINIIGIPSWIAIIWLGGFYYFSFIAVCALIGLVEFYSMSELKGVTPNRYVGITFSILILAYYWFTPQVSETLFIGFLIIGIMWLLMEELYRGLPNAVGNMSYTFFGIFYSPLLLGTAIPIRQFDSINNISLTFALIVSVWACDSAAFFFGTKWGKKKIFPRVSPKKSYIGSIAGVFASFLVMTMFQYFGWLGAMFTGYDIFIFSMITGILGQVGDFAESLIKRDVGVKDSGTILRGHGGVLDRFDSLIFAMPIAYLYTHFLELI
ncbi:MAG: phosphatidate cytidylyltransferase [Candidatus Marinimicrobia bacterium]|jgi:phosphatidate cytidylyltransferase|nr:phosphatidate cytidylyltransferase [Candidatus Neomarinimicrobiota bacterium]MBT3937590.1 phosphatidate cytidylyltransferase [Candidatus Neomarinimicrobiota bacterium]MBT3960703.1 phosphatidate cytidylyltransferase [Candidatus Neomarinimicrobiota bacterium]MBT4382893.1 phosphatidate cytidylyltransferase [Candidatus Neomarinimicrobiota bacterium]MBT4635093.1 phosphatidate cytidylyltransferase [Candidatus Neomarinimicrobiota bacterium]